MEYFAVIRIAFGQYILTVSETERSWSDTDIAVRAERLQQEIAAQEWVRVVDTSMQIRKESIQCMFTEMYSVENDVVTLVNTDGLATFQTAY